MGRVLIACEESQVVCKAFRAYGHEAYSCDVVDCSGGYPEWHIKSDVRFILPGRCRFVTVDGFVHYVEKWDLVIAHPPCTRLCNSGQRWLYYGSSEYRDKKIKEQKEAIDFFMFFTNLKCPCAIENPVGIMSSVYRKPDQIYNPYNFNGETEAKKTCLWLNDLPSLRYTQKCKNIVVTRNIWKAFFDGKQYSWNDPAVARFRSKTPIGVALAMAEQWGVLI